jgi:DNA (cytosine-5)-methyltransferase 1
MSNFTYIDLFAGCGGLSLGLQKAGLQGIWSIEIDKDAVATYRKNIGDHIHCTDIRQVDTATIPHADLLVGGFPCQPFSISGLQRGFSGKDGDLFYQCVRFIKNIAPSVFILENVPGFLRLKKGQFYKEAISVLRSLGYFVEWKILNSADCGVPQVRERLFIMGNNLGRRNLFPKPTGQRISAQEAIEDIRLNMGTFKNNVPMRHTERIKHRFAAVRPGETARAAMDRDPSLGTAKITKQCYRRMIATDPAPTIVANFVTTTIHYCENRNLTAREAARLQSFPDDFEFMGLKTRMSWQKGLSQFEQIGNAVPPKVGEALGKCAIQILKGLTPALSKAEFKEQEQRPLFLLDDLEADACKENIGLTNHFNGTNRGRKSRFAHIYRQIEALQPNGSLQIPTETPEEFFTFLKGAMRRRGISYILSRDADELATITVKGCTDED